MTPLVFVLEWRRALAHRRRAILSAVLPMAVVLPVATGALPPGPAATASALLFGLFCVLGSATSLSGDAQTGLAARVVRGGVAPYSYLLQRALAGAVIDVLQLTPALLLVVVAVGGSPTEAIFAWGALAAAAWIGGLVGVVLASLSRSMAEAALFATVSGLLLLHMSGAFTGTRPGGLAAALEGASPYRALHEGFLGMATGAPVSGGVGALAWSVAAAFVVAVAAGPLLSSLSHQGHGSPSGVT